VVLRTVAGRRTGESTEDLESWLVQLQDCPPVTRTVLTTCTNAVHGGEPATWFYVEADAETAVARHRCMSCGDSQDVLDSAEHWNFPRMWACPSCSQSIAEIASGLHTDEHGAVNWLALAARCVDCGTIDGLTDFNLDAMPTDEVLRRL
jgi:ferredoxin-like protein FixX